MGAERSMSSLLTTSWLWTQLWKQFAQMLQTPGAVTSHLMNGTSKCAPGQTLLGLSKFWQSVPTVTEKKPGHPRTQTSQIPCAATLPPPCKFQVLVQDLGQRGLGLRGYLCKLKGTRHWNPKTTEPSNRKQAHSCPLPPLNVREPWMSCVCWSPSPCLAPLLLKVGVTDQPASEQQESSVLLYWKTFSHCYFKNCLQRKPSCSQSKATGGSREHKHLGT